MNEALGVGEQVSVVVTRHTTILPYLLVLVAIALAIYVYLLLKQRREDGTEIGCN